MIVEQVNLLKLKEVVSRLESWEIDKILSAKKPYFGFHLHNHHGLYISVSNGVDSCQWCLKYKHSHYNHFQIVKTINCSLNNSIQSIVDCIENELLCHMDIAYEKSKQEGARSKHRYIHKHPSAVEKRQLGG